MRACMPCSRQQSVLTMTMAMSGRSWVEEARISPGYTLNRAFQSYRQPGSAIKPLIVYTPSFERNYTPDSVVTDEPIEDGPRMQMVPIPVRSQSGRPVEKSVNTIAWKLYEELTPEVGLSYLEK